MGETRAPLHALRVAIPDDDLNRRIKCMLHDAGRVAHVPGVVMRRAQWLGQIDDINQLLSAFRDRHDISLPAWEVHLPYDYTTFLCEPLGYHPRHRMRALWSSQRNHANEFELTNVQDYGDAFVTVAALGNLAVLTELTQQASQVEVDVAQMLEVACANGHWELAKWLCAPTAWAKLAPWTAPSEVKAQVQRAAHRAMKSVVIKRDGKALDAMLVVVYFLGLSREYAPGFEATHEPLTKNVPGFEATHEPLANDGGGEMSTELAGQVPKLKTENHTDNAVDVLTNPLLLARIGIFQETAAEAAKRFQEQSGLACAIKKSLAMETLSNLSRIAIIEGNLYALQQLFYYPRNTPLNPYNPYNFRLAMHFAAMEGQVEILKWLHTLPGDKHKCRPDTMAMAVRCGWPEVVEWLHFNCPESAQTMSAHCVNDAAYWGHVDVLRVCHEYDLGEITSAAMERAAGAGQLEALQYLCSIREDVPTSSAMDSAIGFGHARVVEWLYKDQHQAITSDRLALSFTSTGDTDDKVQRFILSVLHTEGVLAVDCEENPFIQMCATGVDVAVAALMPLILTHKKNYDLIHRGFRAAIAGGHVAIVQQLFAHFVATGERKTLREPLGEENVPLMRSLVEAGRITPKELDALFRMFVAPNWTASGSTVMSLIDLEVDTYCANALPLLAQGEWHRKRQTKRSAIKRIYPRRTQQSAVQALRVATDSLALKFLLQMEDKHYTERILMANAPPCLVSQLLRYFIRHGRAVDPDAVARFGRVATEPNGVLTTEEVNSLSKLHDQEINALVVANRGVLLTLQPWFDSAWAGNTALLEYLCRQVPDPVHENAAIEYACESGCLPTLRFFFAKSSGRQVTQRMIQVAAEAQQRESIRFLLEEQDHSYVHQLVYGLLLRELRKRSQFFEEEPKEWVFALIGMVLRTSPQQQKYQTLLEITAKAGSLQALQIVLASLSSGSAGLDAAATVTMMPAMVEAARGGHKEILQLLYTNKRPEEAINVGQLRQSFSSISDASAMAMLLSAFEEWDPSVRDQLEQERSAPTSFFGFSAGSASVFGINKST